VHNIGTEPGSPPSALLCYLFRMFNIFDRVLEGKGVGWSSLRFALILAPAAILLIVLSKAFSLD
jgi:hypothetical protein